MSDGVPVWSLERNGGVPGAGDYRGIDMDELRETAGDAVNEMIKHLRDHPDVRVQVDGNMVIKMRMYIGIAVK
jgi:hypothetical protein